MKLKKVCLVLFGVLFPLLLNGISCIANHNQEENLIGEEDRRAAESYDKRGFYDTSGSHNRHRTYPSGYDHTATFSSPEYAYPSITAYGTGPAYSSGHDSYGLYGTSGHGSGHSSPSYGGGRSALALKGLLIPLAGIALLGAAAALSSHPVLLQLGVVNGRRRRRRSFNLNTHSTNPYIKLFD